MNAVVDMPRQSERLEAHGEEYWSNSRQVQGRYKAGTRQVQGRYAAVDQPAAQPGLSMSGRQEADSERSDLESIP